MKKAIKEESVPFDGINSIDLEFNFVPNASESRNDSSPSIFYLAWMVLRAIIILANWIWLILAPSQVSEAGWQDGAKGRETAAESWAETAEGRGEGDQEEAAAGEERSGVEWSLQWDQQLGPCPLPAHL